MRSFIMLICRYSHGRSAIANYTCYWCSFRICNRGYYRYSLNQTNAVEGILSVQSNSKYSRFRLVGLYEYHMPIANDFSWFWGFGGSVGSYSGKAYTDDKGNRFDKYSELALSVDGIAGVEYKIPSAPIALSLDIKPYFDFLQSSDLKFSIRSGFPYAIRFK